MAKRTLDVLFFVLLGVVAVIPIFSLIPFIVCVFLTLVLLLIIIVIGVSLFSSSSQNLHELEEQIEANKKAEMANRYRILLCVASDEPLNAFGVRKLTQTEEALLSELFWAITHGFIDKDYIKKYLSTDRFSSLVIALKEQNEPQRPETASDPEFVPESVGLNDLVVAAIRGLDGATVRSSDVVEE